MHGDPRPRGVGSEQVLPPSFGPLSGTEQRALWVQLWAREGPRTRGQNAHTQEAPMRQARGGQLTTRQEVSRMQHCQMQDKGGEQGVGTRSHGATGAEKGCRGPAAFTGLPALLRQRGL